jgi:fibronectin type 3 domain-containing protein
MNEKQTNWYEDRIGELERQNVQLADDVQRLSQTSIGNDHLVSELQQTVAMYQERTSAIAIATAARRCNCAI